MMESFDEFKAKNDRIKQDERKLKKMKMKNQIDQLSKRKQKILTKMNQFVNGSSNYN